VGIQGIDALTRAKTSTVLKGNALRPLKCWKSVGTARSHSRLERFVCIKHLVCGCRARLKAKIPDHQNHEATVTFDR